MMTKRYILAIDQGTSSTKTLIFDEEGTVMAKGVEELQTFYLDDGFVEQDPECIFQNVISSVKKCLDDFCGKGFAIDFVAAIGISNQRETFVIWDKNGVPLHNAVVWQCKRSVRICDELKQKGLSDTINQRTGLLIDPYFSATKLIWLYRNNSSIKNAVSNGEAFFGTIDTWLLYKLTGGDVYATDHTNASRTLLFNLHTLQWDEELIRAYGLTGLRLPEIHTSANNFGKTNLHGCMKQDVPVTAIVGDSHAAAFGEGCYEKGTAKATMGTGSSILMNIGNKPLRSENGMVTTICWSINGRVDYAYEGVIVSCGSTIEWIRNSLQLFNSNDETESMAKSVENNGGVYLVPAFSGLGSPYWQMERRAAITGMSFATSKAHIVRAALESIAYQVKDVIMAMQKDAQVDLKELHTDGGITNNAFLMQFLADLLNKNVSTTGIADVSAQGAAMLAGLQAGIYKNLHKLKKMSKRQKQFIPADTANAAKYHEGWMSQIVQYDLKENNV